MKKSFLFMIIFTAVLSLTACNVNSNTTTAETQTPEPQGLIAEGRLIPINSMEQSFSLSGQVIDVLIKDGEQVQAGQVLARLMVTSDAKLALARAEQEALSAQQALDALQASADLNLAQSQLSWLRAQDGVDQAQASFDANSSDENRALLDAAVATEKLNEEAYQKIKDGQGVDPDQLSAAQARVKTASAAVDGAQEFIDAHVLKAAITGRVVDLAVQSGQRVAAGTSILQIVDFSGWNIETDNLTEMEIPKVSVGQKVEVVLDALPDIPLQGEVTQINARFEEKRGDITYTATIRLEQSDPRMRWGMTAAVHFLP
ncbi:multidrug resistance efflux pump [Longilinea arvoryzae]|uniref:Multidrug resistance efflux pump n=1 Tax=Longilinea arvoryzae TaxID=360412 RepID=A0A0S7BLZ2_9CHLR|nr:HlyD family efflux transporter periplasmic adaptor subunit [Longilinea arvoryzae]GAP15699.1 multidrug resistance efflux pump [Longilinea arvoryzae]